MMIRKVVRKLFLQLEAVDRSWRDWEDDGDWIWEDGGANPRVATTTAAIVDDPSSMGIYITRWSAKRLREIANTVKEKKRDVISKSSFGDLLHISPLPPPPEELVDFIVMRIDTKKRLLKTWILLCLSLVLAPGTGNMVPLEYLHTLQELSVVHEFEWDEHILLDAMKEVKKYQDKRNEGKLKFHIGGCLPMLLVIYMDHIDIPRGCIVDHVIDYSLPRACFVKELDFTAVIAVDTIEDGFGKRPFSSTSPYATTKFLSYIEQLAKLPNKASMSATEIPDMVGADGVQQPTEGATNKADGTTRNVHEPPSKNTEGGDDVCGSLEDWLYPLPAFDELELPPHMRAIFNKHKYIHAAELKGALSSFGSLLEGIYLKRMGLMLSEASKAGFRSDEAKHDVTFHAAAAPAPGMCKATANDSSPQQQKKRDTNTGTINASVTISSPQQPKQPNNLEQGNTSTAQSTVIASSMQQASQPDNTKSVDPGVVVGKTNADKKNHKSESENNIGDDRNNAKGEDICSRVNLIRRPGETALEDGPSFGLFEPGSPDALLFQDVPQVESPPRSPVVDIESFMEIRARSPLFDNLFAAAASPGPVYDVTPLATFPPISTGPAACIDDTIEEAQVEVSSGQGHDQKHPTLKRVAPTETTAAKLPKMKKKKIDAMDDAIYQRYCCTNYKIKDPPRGEPLPSFIRIGGFDISFKHFSNGLKKRAHVNNEVMSLYIESFNIEHMYSSSKPRKFAFSPHVASKLCVDPSSFNTNSCTKDLKRACEKNDIAKADQLFFTIVKQDHWAVVVLNLIHKQFNVFDSNIRDSHYVSILEKPCSNLIENFKTLVRGRNPWKHNLDMFERFSPSGYPHQSTTFDCGLFAILYMENLTARGLKPFNTDTTSLLNFRKYIAAKLFKHPQNTLSSEEELEKLLKKS
uniref:Ubiquitin-like protease family profile domain-containing protein n=1 Tax=Hordeum vulgare subsp. vulgare TaxID=112509 RepID=A0A8I6YDM8_HORVV